MSDHRLTVVTWTAPSAATRPGMIEVVQGWAAACDCGWHGAPQQHPIQSLDEYAAHISDPPPAALRPLCCEAAMPPYSGYTQEGDAFDCPTCAKRWVWIEEESDGGWWEPVQS